MDKLKRKKEKATLIQPEHDGRKDLLNRLSLVWENIVTGLLLFDSFNMPHFGDVPEINNFLKTADPKFITEAIRKNPLYMHDQRIHASIDLCQGLRSNLLEWKHKDGLDGASLLRERCGQVLDAISKGLRTDIKYGRPRKSTHLFFDALLERQWKTFRYKGMKALPSRLRGKRPYAQRLNDLESVITKMSPRFPCSIDRDTMEKLNYNFKKREPLLKAIFGCLVGIKAGTKRNMKPKSIVKAVDRLLGKSE